MCQARIADAGEDQNRGLRFGLRLFKRVTVGNTRFAVAVERAVVHAGRLRPAGAGHIARRAVGVAVLGVVILHVLVHGIARGLKRIVEVDEIVRQVRARLRNRARADIHRGIGRIAEQRDAAVILGRGHRQRAVVLQKDDALLRDGFGQLGGRVGRLQLRIVRFGLHRAERTEPEPRDDGAVADCQRVRRKAHDEQ